jgi:hypothetical protein
VNFADLSNKLFTSACRNEGKGRETRQGYSLLQKLLVKSFFGFEIESFANDFVENLPNCHVLC